MTKPIWENPIDPLTHLIGSVTRGPDSSLFESDFPDMKAWANAGVTGGISSTPAASAHIPLGSSASDIQTVIDQVGDSGGGTVLIEAGQYSINQPLHLRNKVILRGPYMDSVKLEFKLRGTFPGFSDPRRPRIESAIRFDGIHSAGIEHLTLVFDEDTPRIRGVRHLENPFDDKKHGPDEDLFVNSVWIHRSRDCFVQFCRIIDSGSNPLVIQESSHITARYCEIHGAHMRSGGQAYLNLEGSESCLLAGLVIKDIRHLSIMSGTDEYPCRHNVVIACDLEVDINFHSGDSGHNLIQDCRIFIPSWHYWGPFALGAPNKHQPPGPDNLIYRCQALRARFATLPRTRMAEDPELVYRLRDSFDHSQPLLTPLAQKPGSGTLYAVTS